MQLSGQPLITQSAQPERSSRSLRIDINNILVDRGKDEDLSPLYWPALVNAQTAEPQWLWGCERVAAPAARSL